MIVILNGVLYVLVLMKLGIFIDSIMYCAIISLLIEISIIDLRHKLIPDKLNIIVLVFGLFFLLHDKTMIVNRLIGFGIGFGLFLFIAVLTNSMGGGDIKLMASLGLIFGINGIVFIILFSFILGAIISTILLILQIKKLKDEIPFAPFISFSALIYILLWK
ncbi:prepilin peptidase [Sedimentibacter sp. MB31-C6]|uniref:prepilin peptidase n=1 Tax=Sedimentibacter sp. MB31-C6 TaxID=3109366 RepID=UPI002DDD987F|nr:A24 family peptidase [Sedimentibacter sp. MB36-C1]WSI03806.1 A24 family peptidase [Sedimentibacter sp. MB36-C1]